MFGFVADAVIAFFGKLWRILMLYGKFQADVLFSVLLMEEDR